MTVSGFFNPSPIVHSFLALEHAFEIFFHSHSIRIAHSKGNWYLAKMRDTRVSDFIKISDCFNGACCGDELTLSLYRYFESKGKKTSKGIYGDRDNEATAINEFLKIWAGSYTGIDRIQSYQAGRNSYIDPETGEFSFMPREEEFSK